MITQGAQKRIAAVAALSLFAGLLTTTGAQASVEQPISGFEVNGDWTPMEMADQTLFNYPTANGVKDNANKPEFASRTGATIGAVKVEAVLEKYADTAPGTMYFEPGSTHAGYKADKNILFKAEPVLNAPSLNYTLSASPHCVDSNLPVNEKMNFAGRCTYGELVLKFDRPVTDPVLDLTGMGGNSPMAGWFGAKPTTREQAVERLRGRVSRVAGDLVLLTEGATLQNPASTSPTNFVLDEDEGRPRIRTKSVLADIRCDASFNRPMSSGTGGARYALFDTADLPKPIPAGCGSVLVKGQNLTELRFKVSTNVRPLSMSDQEGWGGPGQPGENFRANEADYPQNLPAVGRAAADGINGNFWHPEFGRAELTKLNEEKNSVQNVLEELIRVTVRIPQYAIGDYIWIDADGDGIQDADEQPAQGVVVELLHEDGAPVRMSDGTPMTTTTDANGKYVFEGLSHGVKYRVRVTPPAGMTLTQPNAGGENATNDSKMDQFSRTSAAVEFSADEYQAFLDDPSRNDFEKLNLDLDAGLIPAKPGIEVVKKINGYDADTLETAPVVNAGENLKVTFMVKNTGNVPVQNVTIADTTIAAKAITEPTVKYNKDGQEAGDFKVRVDPDTTKSILLPGEYAFFTATIPALEAGATHTNTATVTAQPPFNPNDPNADPNNPPTVTDSDDAKAKAPKLTLKKYINGDDAQKAPGVVINDADGTMTIKYVITNDSDVDINGITVTDEILSTTNTGLGKEIADKLAEVGAFDLTAHAVKEIEITVTAPQRGEANNHGNQASASGAPQQITTAPDAKIPGEPADHTNPDLVDQVTSEKDPAYATKPSVAVGDRIWNDADKDGIQGDEEQGLPGITVQLLDENGNPVQDENGQDLTQVTDANGNYRFTNLKPGTYKVKVVAPEGYSFSPVGQGVDTTKNSKADPATGLSGAMNVPSGSNLNFDAGLYRLPSSIEVIKRVNNHVAQPDAQAKITAAEGSTLHFTYEVRNTGETTLRNVTVADNKIAAADITAPAKVYAANGDEAGAWNGTLAPGQYAFFTATAPAPAAGEAHENTATTRGTTPPVPGSTEPPASVTDEDQAKVYVAKLTLKKYINNQDAEELATSAQITAQTMAIKYVVTNEGEIPVSDISIADTVNTPANSPLQQQINDKLAAQAAAFALQPGEEKTIEITVDAPKTGEAFNHKNTAKATGSTPELPALPEPKPGEPREEIPATTVESNEDVAHAHKSPVSLGDRVWNDTNRDGVQDEGEKGLARVTVTLLNADGTPVLKDGQPVTVVTGEDGSYLFENLDPGSYKVKFTAPVGYAFAPKAIGEDREKDSNADPATGESDPVEILTGTNMSFDAGLYKLNPELTVIKKINGFDANTPEAAAVVATGGNMTVTFFVKNTGETVINNVSVADSTITEEGAITPAANKQAADGSDAGAYAGTLNPGESVVYTATAPAPTVAAGTHKNTATVTGIPPFDPADPAIDPNNPPTVSDTDDAHAITPKLTLKKFITDRNGNKLDAQDDATSAAVIADTMDITFEVHNEGTTTVTGITIADQVTAPAEGGPIADAIAAELAKVAPFDLPALGDKTVTITVPAPAPGEKHADTATATGTPTQPVDPATGQPRQPEPSNPGEPGVNPDASAPTVTSEADPAHAHKPLAKLGSKVWVDKDKDGVLDDDEPGIPGVRVHLLNEDGTPVLDKNGNPLVQITNANGEYLFDNLMPGKYKVRFERPAGFDSTTQSAGDNPGVDSDADVITGESPLVTLVLGDARLDIFAGFIPRDSKIQIVKKINGYDANTPEAAALVAAGSDMVVSYVVSNTGGMTLNNVTVTDKDIPADAVKAPAKRYAADGTEAGEFTGTLAPEEYAVFTATVKAPELAGALHKNTGVVTGDVVADPWTPPFGPENPATVTASDVAHAVTPKLTVKKYINQATPENDGQTPKSEVKVFGSKMKLVFVVTNESPVAVANIRITDRVTVPAESALQAVVDEKLAAIEPFTLEAGASQTFTVEVDTPGYGQQHQDYAKAIGQIVPPAAPEPGKPGEPELPAPGTPDQPGFPPVTSEEDPANAVRPYIPPFTPDTQVPSVPGQPGTPGTPGATDGTPNVPGASTTPGSTPGTPDKGTSTTPGASGTSTVVTDGKVATSGNKVGHLAKTGADTDVLGAFGSITALLGAALVVGASRRRVRD